MKKRVLRTIFSFSAMSLLLSCSDMGLMSPDRMDSNDLVMIKAPSLSVYDVFSRKLTKSGGDPEGFDGLFVKSDLSIGSVHNMDRGSTLWLLIETPGPEYIYKSEYNSPSDVDEPQSWQESEFSYKPYIVGENGAMYPCETMDSTATEGGDELTYRVIKRDSEGNILRLGSALMLPSGLYKFHATSPASPLLISRNGTPQEPTVHISNGRYVLATDTRWKETYPRGVFIRGGADVSGVHSVSLAALANQTARIRVNVRCSDNINMLGVQKSGIEISGIQEDSHADFRWTMDGEPIETRIGNKYEGVRFDDYKLTEDGEGRDMITATASILPTDARSNTIFVLFHLIVNNVPTQYMVGLTNQLYEAANEYVFNFRVKADGNITVGTWDNISLVYDNVELR